MPDTVPNMACVAAESLLEKLRLPIYDLNRHFNSWEDVRHSFDPVFAKLASTADTDEEHCALTSGETFLSAFTEANYTPANSRTGANDEADLALHAACLKLLACDGESAYSLTKKPHFLILAAVSCERAVERSIRQPLVFFRANLFLLRCLWTWQKLLDDRSETLRAKCLATLAVLDNRLSPPESSAINRPIIIEYHVEASHICHHYFEHENTAKHLKTAVDLAGIDPTLTGALGKRTRFQQDAKPQLFLTTGAVGNGVHIGTDAEPPTEPKKTFFDRIPLEDDTLLDAVSFQQSLPAEQILSPEQCCVLLAVCLHRKRRGPSLISDSLLLEELHAYLDVLLRQPNLPYSVEMRTLQLRSTLESDNVRRSLRAIQQLEALTTPTDNNRMQFDFWFCADMSPQWQVKKQLADLLIKLGDIRQALDLLVSLQLYEAQIECYMRLGQKVKAQHLIKQQLELSETPLLWCLLGEVNNDMECFERAWTVSGQRSARAMKSLGRRYVDRREYRKAIECYEKSLSINSMQIDAWFTLGYAALHLNDFDTAERAFRRCVMLEPEHGQAWNNLGSVLVRQAQAAASDTEKHDMKNIAAYSAMREAAKNNFDSRAIWENCLSLACAVRDYRGIIHAYSRTLDIQQLQKDDGDATGAKNAVDVVALRILVEAVKTDAEGFEKQRAGQLRKEMLALFGRIAAQMPDDSMLWILYADVKMWLLSTAESGEENSLRNSDAGVEVMKLWQNAHRCAVRRHAWSKDPSLRIQAFTIASKMFECYQHIKNGITDADDRARMRAACKMALRQIAAAIEKETPVAIVDENDAALDESKLTDSQRVTKLRNCLRLLEQEEAA